MQRDPLQNVCDPFPFVSWNGRCQGKSQNSNLKARRERAKNEVVDRDYIGVDAHGPRQHGRLSTSADQRGR